MRGNLFARFIDRYIGIIVLFIYGIVRRKRKKPSSIKKVAILKSAGIGDMVLITAILDDLQKFTNCEVTLILSKDNFQILPLVKNYAHSICVDIGKPFHAIKNMMGNKYDCFIDLGSWPRIDAIITALSKSKYTVGFKTSGQFRHYAYDSFFPHSNKIHELDNYRHIVSNVLNISCNSSPKLTPVRKIPFYEKKIILFHMWPGGYKSHNKKWEKGNWLKLIAKLIKIGYTIVLSGTNENKKDNKLISNQFKKNTVLDIAGEYNLVELSDIIDQSDAVVSVNTGIAHISSAIGKPTVCLNGPTSPLRWRPLGKHVRNINSTLDSAGFLNLGFEYNLGPSNTMEYIDVQTVYNNLLELIN